MSIKVSLRVGTSFRVECVPNRVRVQTRVIHDVLGYHLPKRWLVFEAGVGSGLGTSLTQRRVAHSVITVRTIASGRQVSDDGEPHEVRQPEVRHDAVAAAGAEGAIPLAIVSIEIRHVLHHCHAGNLRRTQGQGRSQGQGQGQGSSD